MWTVFWASTRNYFSVYIWFVFYGCLVGALFPIAFDYKLWLYKTFDSFLKEDFELEYNKELPLEVIKDDIKFVKNIIHDSINGSATLSAIMKYPVSYQKYLHTS